MREGGGGVSDQAGGGVAGAAQAVQVAVEVAPASSSEDAVLSASVEAVVEGGRVGDGGGVGWMGQGGAYRKGSGRNCKDTAKKKKKKWYTYKNHARKHRKPSTYF